MKADTFAKLVVLDALIEAEIGYFLEHNPTPFELFREGMVARISDLIDEVDVLDSVAAARVYDAIVDFLAELTEKDAGGVVEATIGFRRAVDRIVERGMDRRELAAASTWAVVLDELLSELADEYHAAASGNEVRQRELMRVESLLLRARQASDRMLWDAEAARPEIASEFDRLAFGVRHQRVRPTEADFLIRSLQQRAARYRPSTLTRIGAFVLKQVLRREGVRRTERPKGREGRAPKPGPRRAV